VLNLGGARGFVANHTGVVVLELADGRRSVAEIVTAVADVFGLDEHPAKPVRAFLDIASSRALVELHRRKDPR
jgi:chemotaxis signal transduction protein